VAGANTAILRRMPAIPYYWTPEELARDAGEARRIFVQQRLALEDDDRRHYGGVLDDGVAAAMRLVESTDGLRHVTGDALRERTVLNIARYATRSLISLDDLDTLTNSCFGAWVGQSTDRGQRPTAAAFEAAAGIVAPRLDPMRAPWLATGQAPSAEEALRFAQWTGSILAASRLIAYRRNRGAQRQEEATRQAIVAAGYAERPTPGRGFDPLAHLAPASFAGRARSVGGASMDVPCRLRDGHPSGIEFVAIECKESNSSINSRKRLFEVSDKRTRWDASGRLPNLNRTVAVLAGVYDLGELAAAQQRGIYVVWEHRLPDLTDFLR
jgi:hypothetical protein